MSSDTPRVRTYLWSDLYFGLLALLFGTTGQLAGLPVLFYLKDRLHLGPETVALFGFLTNLPLYLAFLSGFLRDRWRPRRMGDRAYLLWAGLISGGGYVYLAAGRITYAGLLLAMLVLMALWQMSMTVLQAVSTAVAQRDGRTGEISVVYNISGIMLPGAASTLGGGWLTSHVTPQHTFVLMAALTSATALLSFWRPRAVYDRLAEPSTRPQSTFAAAMRLLRHRPLWPTILILFMINFGLCFGTPLQYYLTDPAHMAIPLSPEEYGRWLALFSITFLPTIALYVPISRRWPLHRSLWAATISLVLQPVGLLFMRTPATAYGAAIAAGLLGGFVSAAFWDLLIRCAPKGLEGTATTLGAAALSGSAAITSLAGASIYAHGGFTLTVWVTVLVYALVFPVLLFVPRSVTATHDR